MEMAKTSPILFCRPQWVLECQTAWEICVLLHCDVCSSSNSYAITKQNCNKLHNLQTDNNKDVNENIGKEWERDIFSILPCLFGKKWPTKRATMRTIRDWIIKEKPTLQETWFLSLCFFYFAIFEHNLPLLTCWSLTARQSVCVW